VKYIQENYLGGWEWFSTILKSGRIIS